jgi:hypothetical protein
MVGACHEGQQLRAGDPRAATEHGREYKPVAAAATAAADAGGSAQEAPLGPVLWAVSIASCGALAFGYHLGVVNGPLNAIAADLGFAGNAGLQGTVRRTPLLQSPFLHYSCSGSASQHAWQAARQAGSTVSHKGGCWVNAP